MNHAYGSFRFAALSAAAFLLCCAGAAQAQFRLILDLPRLQDYPMVRVPLQVLDNSASIKTLDTSNFLLRENGVLQYPLYLDCTQEEVPQTINFIFVLDCSLSMGFKEGTRIPDKPDSVKWRRAKQVFVEAFRKLRPTDRGAFISFSEFVALEQYFTSTVRLLEDAIGGLELHSGTSIFDALMAAFDLASSQTGKTVIIILTDGSDTHSTSTLAQAIARGRASSIPIYSIGLGVEAGDIPVFRDMSLNTGGEYFIAPTSDQLNDVFTRIMQSIYSSRCLLSYVPADTCRRGTKRIVDVTVRYNGLSATESTYYSVDDLRSRVLVSVSEDSVDDDQRVSIPVMIGGEVRPNERLDFELMLDIDPSYLVFLGIDTKGGILENDTVTVRRISARQVLVSASAVMPLRGVPYGVRDILVLLRCDVPHRNRNEMTPVSVVPVNFRQNCDMLARGDTSNVSVHGCPERLRLGIDSLIVVRSGEPFTVPVRLYDGIDEQQSFRYSFTVRYDTSLIRYTGFDRTYTLSENAPVNVVEFPAGTLAVNAAPSYPVASEGNILLLRFDASAQNTAHRVQFHIDQVSLMQSCVPVIEFSGDGLFIDGKCERILVRRGGAAIQQISPQPASLSQSRSVDVSFVLGASGRATIACSDLAGRQFAVPFDLFADAGEHSVSLPLERFTPGTYIVTLSQGETVAVAKLIVTR